MPEEAGDRQLEAAVAARLQLEDRERDHGGDQAGRERRHAEQQVERDRGADELGQVGRDGDRLGLDPQPPGDGAREALAAQLGQVAAGRDARLGRQVLHEHRHQVRGDDHPHQQVAVLGAAGDVGGEVARVDVRDRGDERRAEQREPALEAAARADPPQRRLLGQRLRRGGGVRPRWRRGAGSRPHLHAHRPRERARRAGAPGRRSARTAARRTDGARPPRSASPGRDPELGEIAQHLRLGVRDAPQHAVRAGLQRGEALARLARSAPATAVGIGSPCGSRVGWPSLAAISASSSSERTCSSTSASSCTRSHGTPSELAR